MVGKFHDNYVHHALPSAERSVALQPSKLEGSERTLFANTVYTEWGHQKDLHEALAFVSHNFERRWEKQRPRWLEVLHFLKKPQEEVHNKQ